MKINTQKIISAFMAVCIMLSFCIPVFAVADIHRVSVTINGDADTSRGFCWYTAENSGTEIQPYLVSAYGHCAFLISTPG